MVPTGAGVYVVQPGNRPVVKIGATKHFGRRIGSLSTGSDEPFRVLAFQVSAGRDTPIQMERQWHDALAAHHKRHEWFHLTDALLEYVKHGPWRGDPCPVCYRIDPVTIEGTELSCVCAAVTDCVACNAPGSMLERDEAIVIDVNNTVCWECYDRITNGNSDTAKEVTARLDALLVGNG